MSKLRNALSTMKSLKNGDFLLIVLTLGITIFGIIMVFSASYYLSINTWGNPFHFLIRSIIWAALGLGLMFFLMHINYKLYYYLAPLIMIGSTVLLLLLFTPLGVTRNHATRWLGVGDFTIMPGEVAKIAAIIFVAWFLSKDPARIRSFFKGVLPLILLSAILGYMILRQPALSTAITVVGIIVGIMFVAGLHMFYLAGTLAAGGAGVWFLIHSGVAPHWYHRITSFIDPWADAQNTGYQAVQSLMALGSGGLTGMGLGRGIQKNSNLPEAHNDFILAIIGEELGFIGCVILFAVYLLMIWRGMLIAVNAKDTFGMLLASGITIMLALQVILNIAVVTSSMPPTGITLPFVSYGGNAVLLFMGSMGILLNISRLSSRQES